ncbi:MAG: 4Fe-4S dicluster domain-containing protein [Hydrogenobacter sp.]|uniref:4Fe-4S dicluster domain-containing protein n=1 Tax=Hydrogenobacter thermophilus TaxID=940 RepID=UPI0030F8C752
MLKIDLSLCSGCKRCMLACSFYKSGGFNPRLSSIEVITDISNRPVAYRVRECGECKGFYCVDFCILKAVEVIT